MAVVPGRFASFHIFLVLAVHGYKAARRSGVWCRDLRLCGLSA